MLVFVFWELLVMYLLKLRIFYVIIYIYTGNLVVLMVAFRKHKYRFVTNCYIINLAITDVLFLLISVPLTTYLGLTNTWILNGFVSCRVHIYFAHVSCLLIKIFFSLSTLIVNSTRNKLQLVVLWINSSVLNHR